MRKSRKNVTKRNKKTSTKCIYTDEAKRIIKMIKHLKKNKTIKKR